MKTKLTIITIVSLLTLATAQAQTTTTDAVSLGAPEQFGLQVKVPVYVADASGTALGVDRADRIQALALKLIWTSPEYVTSTTFTFDGVTAPLHPLFSSVMPKPAHLVALVSFSEFSDPIPFRGNGLPDQIGTLELNLKPGVPVGTTFAISIDPVTAELSDVKGMIFEDAGHQTLALGGTTFTYMPSGDANGDGTLTSGDAFYLLNNLFADGPAPLGSGDANQDGRVDPTDVFFLLNHLYGN